LPNAAQKIRVRLNHRSHISVVQIPPALIGISAGIRGVQDELAYAAHAASSVLLTGEHGVGKSLVAREIHDRGARAGGPFVSAACGNLSDDARENRLFGVEYGTRRAAPCADGGWLETADGGTLFLDDVGELGLTTQGVLLRFLDDGRQQRVPPQRQPDRRIPQLNVRLIAATHRNLFDDMKRGTFLERLYYRLNVVHILVPALRHRREDVPVLIEHYMRISSVEHKRDVPLVLPEAMARLMAYPWPGNVSELRAVADWLVLQATGPVEVDSLPPAIGRDKGRPSVVSPEGRGRRGRELSRMAPAAAARRAPAQAARSGSQAG
jgi:DNA-binding NtrC family response regulator